MSNSTQPTDQAPRTQAVVGDTIKTFFFRLGKCTMSSKALDQETALMYLQRMWPNTKIEYVSEEFSHIVEPRSTSVGGLKKSRSSYATHSKKHTASASVVTLADNRTTEERLEQTLADSFGGVA